MCQVDSEPDVTVWQLATAEKAFAEFRSLTRSFLRGELTYDAFERLAGECTVRYDTAVAEQKLRAQQSINATAGVSGAGRHRINEPDYRWPSAEVIHVNEAGNPLTYCSDPDCDGHGADD
jgi:hypothetical protein